MFLIFFLRDKRINSLLKYLNTHCSDSKSGIFFYRSGDGKRNILLGWPHWFSPLRHNTRYDGGYIAFSLFNDAGLRARTTQLSI